jgi:lipoprotein-releasing system permease protein
MKFELMIAVRYLRAKRKQAVISLITLISIIGVAAGVAALIIALAITAGFREDLRNKLLGAQSHVTIFPKNRAAGIPDYMGITNEVQKVPGVVFAAPALYQNVLLSSEAQSHGVVLKGVIPEMESRLSALSQNMVEGSLTGFSDNSMIVGKELSKTLGTFVGDHLTVLSIGTTATPAGLISVPRGFKVTGIFESGLYDYDNGWAYIPLAVAQRLLRIPDVVGVIEVKIADIDHPEVVGKKIIERLGEKFDFTDWAMMNQTLFQALGLERLVTFITIGLIVLVAALNIVASLIMMVLEKTRDIAILMSMGATTTQIRRIFIFQGVIIGVVGTVVGVIVGQIACYVADKYHLIRLAPEVYTIAYVPFRASPLDATIVAAAAILISYLATLYPSAAAAKLQPVEALRYE